MFRKLLVSLIILVSSVLCMASAKWFWHGPKPVVVSHLTPLQQKITRASYAQIGQTLIYDPSYTKLKYPMGDVALVRGVCTDVVIRALRSVGIDLQQLVHEDMKANFAKYPKNWGAKRPDTNIDHRRVPNLDTYFKRKGWQLRTSNQTFLPGDIVAWKMDGGQDHIGMISQKVLGRRPMVIHNYGYGAQEEDVLRRWKIVGHYRVPNRLSVTHQ